MKSTADMSRITWSLAAAASDRQSSNRWLEVMSSSPCTLTTTLAPWVSIEKRSSATLRSSGLGSDGRYSPRIVCPALTSCDDTGTVSADVLLGGTCEAGYRMYRNAHPWTLTAAKRRMAAYMRDHQDKVVGRWSELVVAGLRGRSSAAEVRRELEDLYSLVVRAMSGADEQAAGELRAALAELSGSRARNGFTPTETALGVFALKDAVFELVADAAELAPEYLAFSRMIDDLGLLTFETYAAAREQIIADQASAMLELSTPVIRLWEGVIAVPLVGALDSARTQLVMEKLLETLVATGADHAVLDITGVSTVDTEVAQHLLKTVSAARLLGAECIVSGIRPQVAQTIVSLGIEFGDIATKATLADALAHVLNRRGQRIGQQRTGQQRTEPQQPGPA